LREQEVQREAIGLLASPVSRKCSPKEEGLSPGCRSRLILHGSRIPVMGVKNWKNSKLRTETVKFEFSKPPLGVVTRSMHRQINHWQNWQISKEWVDKPVFSRDLK